MMGCNKPEKWVRTRQKEKDHSCTDAEGKLEKSVMAKWKSIKFLTFRTLLLKTVSALLFVHNYACQTAT